MGTPLKLSGYYLNNTRKSFDYTMNRVFDVLENQRIPESKTEFVGQIISGNLTGDTTTESVFDFSLSFLNEVETGVYKFRFINQDEKYNTFQDPFSGELSDEEIKQLVSLHKEAFFEKSTELVTPPSQGSTVLLNVQDGIFKITKILTPGDGQEIDFQDPSASKSFLNPKSPFSFMRDFLDNPRGNWTIGDGVRFRNTQEEKRATQFLNELVQIATPHGIPVHVNSAYRSPTDQARVVAGNTARTNGRNLSVYGETTTKMYLRYGRAAHANPKGPEMKKLIDYETRKLANALKRDPNYHGHGTGYAFDLRIRGFNRQQLKKYKDLIESLGAKVLYEKHPPHYHIWLKDWVPKEQSLLDQGLEKMRDLTNSLKEDAE